MGFWHTGYMEFHEPFLPDYDGLYKPPPTVYRCEHCGATFNDPDDLRTHRFEDHPYYRPVLWLGGTEVGTTPQTIVSHIPPHEIITSQCSKAWLNGELFQADQIGMRLAQITNDTVRIKLANEWVEAEFTLKYDIASKAHIKGVDQCFLTIARGKRLDKRSITDFIDAAKVYPSASRYLDGICLYFYGVLAKEKSPESTILHHEYVEFFNRAADELKGFYTPLARTIGALIEFHFNHFMEATILAEDSRVGIVSNRFATWLSGSSEFDSRELLLAQPINPYLESMLTDADAERLLVWSAASPSELRQQLPDMEALLRTNIPEFDRAKMHILLAESYAENNDHAAATNHARELRNSASMGDWADHFLERIR